MIAFIDPSRFPRSPFEVIRDSPVSFYLTGSRFFGNATSTSDWDFMAEDSSEVETLLIQNGFTRVDVDNYSDFSITKVFAHIQCNIHVQLIRKDYLRRKIAAQHFLTNFPFSTDMDKILRGLIWNWALDHPVVKG